MTSVPPPGPPAPRPRARELGLVFGEFETGPNNAITDVPGVRVGHVTVWHGDGDDPIARTGVTAIVPDDPAALFARPMPAATSVLNGAGELTGTIEMAEWGVLETPILLTGTSSVGRVSDGVVDELFAAGADEVVIPVVGECDDSHLDDMRRRWVTAAHARAALAAATDGPVPEGAVGAGAGMVTMGHKAGIGTASRHLPGVGTVGVLLLCNFGALSDLRIGGVMVGAALAAAPAVMPPAPTLDQGGSCLGIVCTDIPLDARQLARVAKRVGLGLARVGSVAHHGSGDIFCAVSTANRQGRNATGRATVELLLDGSINEVFAAVVDATEEAVCNALFVADTVSGVGGQVVPGLPVDQVLAMVSRSRPAP
ncbi:MAG: P1 family peptidase [Ilumatobacteraceae bacterium]